MKILFFLLSTLFFLNPSFSQSIKKDSVSDLQLKDAIDLYNSFSSDNAPVYNGAAYIYYTFKMEGDPYFITGNFSDGWVNYSGRKYDSLSLMYDVSRNQLVILGPPDKKSRIVLQNEFVDSFNLLGHTFINLDEDHQQNLYNGGFYDLLYNGKVQFLARRVKTMNASIKGDLLIRTFYVKDRFYIHKNGLYYLVNTKKDVYRLFDDKIRDVKKMMRKQHVKIRHKNFEYAATKVTQFYDQLTH
jgi:hypothetical protein